MFDLKVGFLQDQNFNLRRQLNSLRQILKVQSQPNERSLVYQLQSLNDKLSEELQDCKNELLLEKQAREIQKSEHQMITEELNRCIFELKQQIQVLENIVRQQTKEIKQKQKFEGTASLGQLFRCKQEKKNQILHQQVDSVFIFDFIQDALEDKLEEPSQMFQEFENQLNRTEQNLIQKPQSTKHILERVTTKISSTSRDKSRFEQSYSLNLPILQNSEVESPAPKWRDQRSSLYFLKHKQKEEMHLKLGKVKELQKMINTVKGEKKQASESNTTNVEVLRKSYFQLIRQYEIMKKRVRALGLYIQELQNRNNLLLKSRLCIRIQ